MPVTPRAVGGHPGAVGAGGSLVCPHSPGRPGPTEAWCSAGDDSTDGSAAAPDDDGKDDSKAEDLGELRGRPRPYRRVVRDGPSPPRGPGGGGLERLRPSRRSRSMVEEYALGGGREGRRGTLWFPRLA